jgi:mRNA interferase MazF
MPKFSFLNAESVANVQGIASIPSVRLERRIGTLPGNIPVGIRRALSFALDLDH